MGNASGREDDGVGNDTTIISAGEVGEGEADNMDDSNNNGNRGEAAGSTSASESSSMSHPGKPSNHHHPPPPAAAAAADAASPSTTPFLFPPQPQVPLTPLQRANGPPSLHQMWQNEPHGVGDRHSQRGIPVIIYWNYGGNEVHVEGSWDNWTSRKKLQRTGKDHSIVLVLPSGIYHHKFIVDGEWRYIPDLPFEADEMGHACNLLDVNDYVPENTDGIVEFEPPPSPDSTYSQEFPAEEDFAKEPVLVPPQLHLTVLDMEENSKEASSSKPQHVVLNHLFIEKGWASQSLVALGITHRFQSKYVTVCLYKPLKR